MNLSKIYRGTETASLTPFQFRSFGGAEPVAEADDKRQHGVATTQAKEKPNVAPPAPQGPTPRDVEEAYARGRREGLDEARQELESATQALAQAVEEISRLRDILAKNSRTDMLRLVMAIAEQVILREVNVAPETVLSIIENALQASVRADQYRVHINPADLELVSKQKPLFLASISGLRNLSVEADQTITRGGCRIESELGDVDATIETQLETIQQALNEAITDG